MDEVFKARTLRVIDLYDLLVIEDQNPSVFDGKLGAYEIKRVFWPGWRQLGQPIFVLGYTIQCVDFWRSTALTRCG